MSTAPGADVNGDGQTYANLIATDPVKAQRARQIDELQAKINVCNRAKADLLLSIHLNGFSDPSVGGYETWSSSARPFVANNRRIAQLVFDQLGQHMRAAGYNAHARRFNDDADANVIASGDVFDRYIITGPAEPGKITPSVMPGAIIESLFISNDQDAAFVATAAGQDAIATAIRSYPRLFQRRRRRPAAARSRNMPSKLSERRTTRRKLIAGAGAAAALTAAPSLSAKAGPIAMPAVRIARNAVEIPDGMAIVTLPRVPLFDVGPDDAGHLLAGSFPNWLALGSPVCCAIEPVAVGTQPPAGMMPAETYGDYDALIKGFEKRPGAVALVPADQVDARVNVLAVDGFDPVRDGEFGEPPIRIGFVGDIVPGRNVVHQDARVQRLHASLFTPGRR